MKFNTLFCFLLLFQFSEVRASFPVNSTFTSIPLVDIVFQNMNLSSNAFISNSKHNISSVNGTDSIFIYQKELHKPFIAIGKDTSYIKADLSIPFNLNSLDIQYHYYFDSLGTNQQYLILKWFGKDISTYSTYSGSEEFMCHNTQYETRTRIFGQTIISIKTLQILFQGITKIEEEKIKIKYPGGYKTSLNSETIFKTKYFPNQPYLRLYHSNYDAYNYLEYNKIATPGTYQIVNNQFVLLKH